MPRPTVLTISQLGDRVDLEVRRGVTLGPIQSTLKIKGTNTPIDLTGATVRGMVRKDYKDAASLASFTTLVTSPTGGIFTFTIPDETTELLPAKAPFTQYVWDMEILFADGTQLALYHGVLKVYPDVTHDTREPDPEPVENPCA